MIASTGVGILRKMTEQEKSELERAVSANRAKIDALRAEIAATKLEMAAAVESLDVANQPSWNADRYGAAREEHAWLLRAEGLKLREIGDRLGIGQARARVMVQRFGRRTAKAMKRTSFEFV